MHRCAAPWVMARVGAVAAFSFSSALASASGLRVNCTPLASARYSRLRLTAIARSRVTIGAITSVISQSTSTTSASGLLPFFPPDEPLPPLTRPPLPSIRPIPSDISAMEPTIAASSVISRTS